jgi:hypothetical protein
MFKAVPVKKSAGARKTPFQKAHLIEYGLKIIEQDLTTQAVLAVRCQFCVYYSREESTTTVQPRKRAQTSLIKDWKAPYRSELYREHHTKQHNTRWRYYQALSNNEKEAYFKDKTQFRDTILSHLEPQSTHLIFKINSGIVDKIIGEMLFHPDEQDGISQARALKLFAPNEDADEDGYIITIKNPLQFRLITKYLARGLSFRQAEAVYIDTRQTTGMAKMGNITDTIVANYARIVCAINLQTLSSILNNPKIWAFSIANDSSTHYGHSYFDNRIRFHLDGVIYNIHALAIPMCERHTGANMYNLISEFLEIICPEWRAKLIGAGSDGASSMTGHIRGAVTRIENAAEYKIYRVWCGLHQLDLVMKYAYSNLKDGEFNKIMHTITKYLRHQQNLIAEMGSKCPKATTTRWTAMGITCKWLLEKHAQVLEYISEDSPTQAPSDWWWVTTASVSAISEQVNVVLTKLQSKELLISQQAEELQQLAAVLCAQIEVDGPLTEDEIATRDPITCCSFSRWSVSHESILNHVFDQGIFIQETYERLSDVQKVEIIQIIAKFILQVIDGILEIQAERNSANLPADDVPPVLPQQPVKIRGRDFSTIVSTHLDHLKRFWNQEEITMLESQYRRLVLLYQHDLTFKRALDQCDHNTSFEMSWGIVNQSEIGQFDILRYFCGGIATIFPNTATVESDFSVLGWEKDEFRQSLTDLSLEGILQCKQFEMLSGLIR